MPNPVRPQQSAGLWVEPRPAMTKSPVGTVFRLRSAALLCKILQPHKSPALSTTNQAPCFEFDIASLPAMSSEWELPDLRWLDAAGGKPACDNAEEPGTDDFLPSQYNQSSCSHLLSPTPDGQHHAEQRQEGSLSGCGSKVAHTSDHDIHIRTERARRKKMNNMFATLHSLLPRRTAKADKSTIVDEAISYIQSLAQTLVALDRRRCEFAAAPPVYVPGQIQSSQMHFAPVGSDCEVISNCSTEEAGSVSCPADYPRFHTLSSPNVVLNVCGQDAFISICSSRQPRLLSRILFVMEKHKLFVMNAHINSTNSSSLYMIHAQPTHSSCQNLEEDYLKNTLDDLSNCLLST